MKAGRKVRVEKLQATPDAIYPPGDKDKWVNGQYNGAVSLPTGYWIEGVLRSDIKVNLPVSINREIRNGERVDGIFETSPVKLIVGTTFCTQNSVYKVTELEALEN